MIVETKKGKVEGFSEGGVEKFLGIPFAKAPVGKLRFKNAEEVEPWEGVLKADSFGTKCPQLLIPVSPDSGIPQDEDCLFMNIYTTADTDNKKPVFVWIYGGALSAGEGSTDTYEGSEFVRNGDIVVVNFNYRVGVFGGFYNFAGYPGCEDYAANCGISDVLEALKFVKTNISAFGGDPERITIGGESAGASLVSLLTCLPEAKGLFSQAAMESTFPYDPVKPDDREVTDKILACTGFGAEDAKEFLKLPADQIMKAVFDSCGGNPLVCGASLQTSSMAPQNLALMYASICSDVPVLIGMNHDEAAIFAPPGAPAEQVIGMTKAIFESTATQYITSASRTAPVYLYRYDFVPAPLKAQGMGAIHSAEMPCVFHNLTCQSAAMMQADPEGAELVSRKMHGAWIDFIQGKAPWDAYTLERKAYMNFNTESSQFEGGWEL